MIAKLLRIVKYAIVLGAVSGVASSLNAIFPRHYLDYHMYRTALVTAMRITDCNVVLLAVTLFVVAYLWELGVSMKSHIWIRSAYRAVICISGVVFLSWTSGVTSALSNPSIRADYLSVFGEDALSLVLAAICLLLGSYVLLRVRRNQRSGANAKGCAAPVSFNTDRILKFLSLGTLLIVLCINFTAAVFSANTALSVRKRPNIIFVMFDTCRADQLGCYGYRRGTSPNIDKFARDAMRFDRAISQATITTASVGSFLTSRYPQNILLRDVNNIPGVPEDLPTLAEVLKDKGYGTSAIISNMLVESKLGFSQGFDYFDEKMKLRVVTSPGVLSLGLKRLEQVKNRPFFMFMLFVDPHTPYVKHKESDFYPGYKGKLGDTVNITDDSAEASSREFSADDVKYLRALYDGEIRFADRHFGRFMAELKRRGLYDNSIIVFLGDHGEEFMEHGLLLHGHAVYEETTHVPLIIKLPKQTRGSVVKGDFPLIDLYPSILKSIGVDPLCTRPQGRAVDLGGLTQSPEDKVFTAEESKFGKLWAVQDNHNKLIWNMTTDETELFDLMKDPGEKTDISKSEPDVLRSLLDAAKEKQNQVGWASNTGGKVGTTDMFTEEEKQRLKSLGYAQ